MSDTMQEQMRRELEAAEEAVEFAPVVAKGQFPPDVLAKFQFTEAQLKDMAQRHADLKINGPEDKKGFAAVHAARMETRDARLTIEKIRKNLNEDAQAWIKTSNGAAKYLSGIIGPTEERLDAEEEAYEAELERIKAEKQREKDAELQRRIDALTAVGHPVVVGDLVNMPATTFAMVLQTATETWQLKEKERLAAEAALAEKRAEEERKAKEAAEAKAKAEAEERARLAEEARKQAEERKRLEAERAEQERKAAEEREAIRKEREDIEAQRRALEREALAKSLREAAEAKAKADQEYREREETARKERETQEAAERAKAEEARRKARDAARPDAEKLLELAEFLKGTAFPVMATEAGRAVLAEIQDANTRYCNFIVSKANSIADMKVMP